MVRQKQKRARTYARNRISSSGEITRRGREKIFESDGVYLLKLVCVLILGTIWLKFRFPTTFVGVPITGLPVGLLIGLLAVSQFEKHQSNRKILYAILILVAVISYFLPAGIVL